MIKTFTVLFLFTFLFSFSTLAQVKTISREEPRTYFGIAMGTGIPTGMFASSDLQEKSAGYAKTGFAAQINFGYRFSQYWGVCGMARAVFNGVNSGPMEGYYNDHATAGDSWRIRPGTWTSTGIMAGLFASVPFTANSSFSFEPKAMIGLMTVSSPQMEFFVTNPKYPGQQGYFNQESKAVATFGYCLGGAIRKNLDDDFSLFLNADYMGGYAQFKNIQTAGSSSTFSKDMNQPVGIVTITIGFGFRF